MLSKDFIILNETNLHVYLEIISLQTQLSSNYIKSTIFKSNKFYKIIKQTKFIELFNQINVTATW